MVWGGYRPRSTCPDCRMVLLLLLCWENAFLGGSPHQEVPDNKFMVFSSSALMRATGSLQPRVKGAGDMRWSFWP